jgi:osmotically-inducible protein OsmY
MTRHDHDKETFTWIDDEELRQLILSYLREEEAFRVVVNDPQSLIVVEVHRGIVTLSGMVRSSAERRAADRLVRALGALGLHNRLRVESEIVWKPD